MSDLGTNPVGPSAMPDAVAEQRGPSPLAARLADYRAMAKPRITLMVVITAAIGYALAWRAGAASPWGWVGLLGTLGGTALSCMAAGVFNQIIERRSDALMPRTAQRPLAAGRVPVSEAVCLGGAWMLAGQGLLCLLGSPLASGLAAFTIASYALLYTPMKRISPIALYLGAIPGAMPPLIGYAAVSGTLSPVAWAMFGIMFVWQVPHFLAIGHLYRDDYAAAGMAMHAVRDPSGASSARRSVAWCVVLLPLGVLPTWLGAAGWVSAAVASAAGIWFFYTAWRFALSKDRPSARRMFFASLMYLPVVLTAVMVDAR